MFEQQEEEGIALRATRWRKRDAKRDDRIFPVSEAEKRAQFRSSAKWSGLEIEGVAKDIVAFVRKIKRPSFSSRLLSRETIQIGNQS